VTPARRRDAAGEWLLVWTVWNLFLAALPVVFAGPLARRIREPAALRLTAAAGLLFLGYGAVGLGVWLGLVPRYNSWDAVVRPLDVAGSALWALAHPPTLLCLAAFAVVLGVLASVVNAAWDALAASLTRRA
jgi:uncharacterized membrane protein